MSDMAEKSTNYPSGLADGGSQKWKSIRDMWKGLGLFFVVPGLYNSYNDHRIKSDKVQACANATDVTACIAAVGK
jgi:protein involved in temperature-dependent protein secretion